MGVGVPLNVVVFTIGGNDFFEGGKNIPLHVRVSIFIDGHPGGRVRNEYDTASGTNAAVF